MTWKSLPAVVTLALGLAACGGGGGGTPVPPGLVPSPLPTSVPTPTPTPNVPGVVRLGAFVGGGTDFVGQMAALEQSLVAINHDNHALALHLHFYGGKPGNPDFIAGVTTDPSIADDFARGRTPVVTWKCADKLSTLASGADDAAYIIPVAQALKALPGTVRLRFFHEFELNLTDGLNAEGEVPNGQYQDCFDAYNPTLTIAQNVPAESAEFIQAWQHIHAVFAAQGVTNVAWVWNPGGAVSAVANDSLMSFFPGVSDVDWIAGDFYDKPIGVCAGSGFASIVSPFYTMAHTSYPNIPIQMTETGEDQSHGGCASGPSWTQAQYFADMQADLPTQFPQVKSIIYFDSQGNAPYDWILQSSGLTAFAAMAANPYFTLSTAPAP